MPLSSLDKIRQVRKGMGNPAIGDVSDEDCAVYLHLAMKQLATIHEFPSLSTYEDVATDGSTDYTLTATDVLRILEPANNLTSGFPMENAAPRWDRDVGRRTGSGAAVWLVPITIEVGECVVRFRPISTGETIRVPYLKVPTVPGHDTSTENFSDLPEAFDMTEISVAVAIGLELTSQRQEAQAEIGISQLHHGGASRSMTKTSQKYYFQTAAHRLLERKGKRN